MEKPPQTVVAAVARETLPKIAPLRQPFPMLLWGWGKQRDGGMEGWGYGWRDGGKEEKRGGGMDGECLEGWMER